MLGYRHCKRFPNVFILGTVLSLVLFYVSREDTLERPKFLPTPFRTVTRTVTRTVSITEVLTAVPAPPTKPKLEKHTYRPDGLLEVNQNGPHPMYELIREAERKWDDKLQRASKTLVDAVREYRRRYKRDPPKGFDLWWEYAVEHSVQLPDEYDQIFHDLEPFWGLEPSDLFDIQTELEAKKDTYTIGKEKGGHVDVLTYAFTEGKYDQLIAGSRKILELLREIDHLLPEFRMTISPHDGPNRLSDWDVKRATLEAAAARTHIEREALPKVNSHGWIYACPPTSLARRIPINLDQPPPPPTRKTFIHDHKKTMDPCIHPDHFHHHGQFLSHNEGPWPQTVMVPEFSYCTTTLHHNIRIPVPYGWVQDVTPRDEDPDFDEKSEERLLWRGSNTGMFHASKTRWQNSQRDFLVRFTNEIDGTVDVLMPSSKEDERVGPQRKLRTSIINPALFDVAFSNKPIACSESVCPRLEELYPWRPFMGQAQAGEYRYVLDVGSAGGVFHKDTSTIADVNFDFVVVGGGTAGSVVANRLSENPAFQVLVIEAGPSNANAFNTEVPLSAFSLAGTQFDWNFTSVPQSGLGGRSVNYTRGHILGGSSSINSMFYTRGSSDDYDRFAQITGDSGWSWNNIQPYIRKNERWTKPADQHDTDGQFDPSVHSTSGMTFVSLPGFPQEIDSMVISTTKQLNQEFPFNLDMNSGKPLGLGWLQSTIGDGQRSSAATSYLSATTTQRPNLHILLETRATRILPTTGQNRTLRTIELLSSSGSLTTVNASKEVILSTGTIGTPVILLHSGIGDKTELGHLGIDTIVDLPDVGRNFTDQPVISVNWATTSQNPFDALLLNATLTARELTVWEQSKTGPMVTVGINHVAWLRLPDNSTIFDQFPDPSAGPNSPHIELAIGSGMASFVPGHSVGVGAAMVTPLSRGTVRLASNDVLANPLIDPGMLSSELDAAALRESIKSAKRFFAAPAWKNFVLGIVGPPANATTDQELESFIRSHTFPSGHIIGTAAMSARNAHHGVVDPDLRVKRVSGLRIVDASVMPFVPCSHTQAPVYIIAERAADLIKADWNSS
ncbi:Choline dehydrogenase, mitochondrial [Leucoagaricus sp. SymC.cos]|nr:Choline dehydrogenase, mitochondrial [Leucoagaricus sp. SymC.cos]